MANIFTRHRTSGGRVAVVAALATAVVLALTVFASGAGASTTSPQKIRPVACRAATFNVYHVVHGVLRVTCYTGTGTKVVRIADVREITTGANTGAFVIGYHGTLIRIVKFLPKKGHDVFRYPGSLTELISVTITRN